MSEETLRFTGELRVDVSTTDADRAAVDGRTADALVVGEVATASGTGLAGLRVTVAPADGQGRGEVLAEALTDGGGSFRVALVGFGALTDLLLTFRVADGQGSVLLEQPVDVALTGGRGRVVLTVALPETQVPPDLLPAVAAGAAESGIDRLDLLVGALSSAAGGPFDGVPLPARQAVVDQLEQAFLDPTRVLSQVAGPVPSLRNL